MHAKGVKDGVVKLVNEKRIIQNYKEEYEFISNLLGKVDIPVYNDDSDVEGNQTVDENKEDNPNFKQTERAQTLQELHERYEALKGEKCNYKGKMLKKGLQNKIKRKKKIYENKNKTKVKKENFDEKPKIIENKPGKCIFNKDGNLVYSKFDFLGETTSALNDEKNRKNETNPKNALIKLQKRENYVKKLEEKGDKTKAEKIKEDVAWENVMKKAEGIKVKDDPVLLKKTLAKKLAKKKASAKKWDQRQKMEVKAKVERQKKRTENLTKRKDEKMKKKHKKAIKKGRYVP